MPSMVSYPEAAMPRRITLLRMKLLPFSAGHYLILERYGSPYVKGGDITTDDVYFFVLVCSMSYEDFQQFIDQDNMPTQVFEWGYDAGDFDLDEVNRTITEYLNTSITIPKYWIEAETEPEDTGAHWVQGLLLVATGKLGYTHTEALNTPLGKLLYDVLKYSQDNGNIRLMTEDEVKMAEGDK